MAEHPQAAVGPAHAVHSQTSGTVTYEQVGHELSGAVPASGTRGLGSVVGAGLEAVVGTIVAPITLATTIAIPSNRSGVAGTALFLVAMVAYYGVFSRHRLVAQAPLEAALLEAAQTEFSP